MNVQVVDLFAIYPIITDRLKCFEHVLFEMSEIIDNLITVVMKCKDKRFALKVCIGANFKYNCIHCDIM